MSNAALKIRNKLFDYIRVADDKKLYAIYNLLENEIEQTNEWWKDKAFVAELKRSDKAMDNRTDKGVTLVQLHQSIDKLHSRKYDK